MREGLAKLGSARRYTFLAEFKRYGNKTNSYTKRIEWTILLVNVKEKTSGKEVTDHIWFSLGDQFKALGELKEGDVLQFDARVDTYIKGYAGWEDEDREQDYRLSRPTKISRTEKRKLIAFIRQ